MPKNLILILLVCISGSTVAQTGGSSQTYSFLERNFFQTYRAEWMIGATPHFKVTERNDEGKIISEQDNAVTVVSLGGFGYEPRLNLYSFTDKASISVSVPFDGFFAIAISYPDDEVNSGFGALTTGLFADFNIGNHSTFNNIDFNGYSFGLGYRLYKAPLIGATRRDYEFSRIATGWSARVQFKKDNRNDLNRLWYIESGIPERFKIQRYTQVANFYVTFGFGQIINY